MNKKRVVIQLHFFGIAITSLTKTISAFSNKKSGEKEKT